MADSPAGSLVPGRLATAAGRILHWRLDAVRPSLRVLDHGAPQAWRGVRGTEPGRRLFLYYWIEDSLPLMLYAGRSGKIPESLQVVCDDTLGGRVVATVLSHLGLPHAPLRLARPTRRIRDVQRLMKSTITTAIAVDGRGPYRKIGIEFPRLVRESGGLACPIAARVDRSWTAWPTPRIVVPRRGARLSIALGSPSSAATDEEELRLGMEQRLSEAVSLAESRLAGGAKGESGEP